MCVCAHAHACVCVCVCARACMCVCGGGGRGQNELDWAWLCEKYANLTERLSLILYPSFSPLAHPFPLPTANRARNFKGKRC